MPVVKKLPEIDLLMEMAEKEPERLEKLRETLIRFVIDGADEPRRQRLRGLQFQIDMVRRRASNPMSATITLWDMMCDSLGSMNRALAGERDDSPTRRSAEIVALPEKP